MANWTMVEKKVSRRAHRKADYGREPQISQMGEGQREAPRRRGSRGRRKRSGSGCDRAGRRWRHSGRAEMALGLQVIYREVVQDLGASAGLEPLRYS